MQLIYAGGCAIYKLSIILPTHRKSPYSEATVRKIRSAGLRGGAEIAVKYVYHLVVVSRVPLTFWCSICVNLLESIFNSLDRDSLWKNRFEGQR
ncbi:hypothetical protein EVAR_46904_1 [Eumeta japonica]|uniref:Uncharacterized protein n=1 Tax=Eumeta variegata TaxID=151549 RepID=A0A4C1Y0S1_EUMVA|nr:hypothetical protein EVAR_46904_1 [Eumeta japonica]